MTNQIKSMYAGFKKTVVGHMIFKNIGSNRGMWTWITGLFYIYVSIYALRRYPEAASTVVQTAGIVISIVFTNYVFSRNSEKKMLNGNGNDSNGSD